MCVCVCVCVCVYTHVYGILYRIKKNEIMPLAATWMDLEVIKLSEVSHIEEDQYFITYMWNLKNGTNELIYSTETDPWT